MGGSEVGKVPPGAREPEGGEPKVVKKKGTTPEGREVKVEGKTDEGMRALFRRAIRDLGPKLGSLKGSVAHLARWVSGTPRKTIEDQIEQFLKKEVEETATNTIIRAFELLPKKEKSVVFLKLLNRMEELESNCPDALKQFLEGIKELNGILVQIGNEREKLETTIRLLDDIHGEEDQKFAQEQLVFRLEAIVPESDEAEEIIQLHLQRKLSRLSPEDKGKALQAIARLPNLWYLNLSKNGLTDEEISTLTESGSKGLTKILELDISENEIEHLPDSFGNLPRDLKTLKMGGNLRSPRGLFMDLVEEVAKVPARYKELGGLKGIAHSFEKLSSKDRKRIDELEIEGVKQFLIKLTEECIGSKPEDIEENLRKLIDVEVEPRFKETAQRCLVFVLIEISQTPLRMEITSLAAIPTEEKG